MTALSHSARARHSGRGKQARSTLVLALGLLVVACGGGAGSAVAQDSDAGTVLITGSNRGIGLEFARQYAERGWQVIATARNPDGADDLRQLAGRHDGITIERLDVTDEAGIDALAEKYRGQPIDLLINNAGVLGDPESQRIGQLDYASFEQVMAVNVYGPLRVSQAFAEHVASSNHKKIAVVSSLSGSIEVSGARGGLVFYNTSKAGVNMAMRVFGSTYRDQGVLVALLHPGGVNTRMLAQAGAAGRGIEPSESVSGMIDVIAALDAETSGTFQDYRGRALPW